MSGLLEWWLVIGLGFIGFSLLGGSTLAVQRRPHFWIRVLLECVGMAAAVVLLFGAIDLRLLPEHVVVLAWLVLVVGALVLAPVCCYHRAASPPRPSDDGGGGGGGGSGPPPPSRPRGGIPLLDAKQSDARARDHTRQKLHIPGPRRPAREPARAPSRVRPSRRS